MRQSAKTSARDLLAALFVESQHEDAIEGALEEAAAKKKASKPPEELGGPQVKVAKMEERLPSLLKILADLGVIDAKDRLKIEGSQYRLVSDSPASHLADSTILFDMAKIDPLVEAGFVALDVDAPREGGVFSVILVPVDQNAPDPGVDEFLEAVQAEEGRGEPAVVTEEAAHNLVARLLGQNESLAYAVQFDADTGDTANCYVRHDVNVSTMSLDDSASFATAQKHLAKRFQSKELAHQFAHNAGWSAYEVVPV